MRVSKELVERWESLPAHERALRAVLWRVVHGRAGTPVSKSERKLVASPWAGPEGVSGYVLAIAGAEDPSTLVVLARSLGAEAFRVEQVLLLAGDRSREIYRHADAVSDRVPRARELRGFVLASVVEHYLRVTGLLARR